MQSPREETSTLLDEIEHYAKRKFQYREEMSSLVELAAAQQKQRVFEDVLFLAKFLWNSFNAMRRIGPADDAYPKLSAEFRDSLEKCATLIKTLVKEGPDSVKERFTKTFFTMTQESMNNLIKLSSELSWLKNYTIDKKKSIL